MPRRNHRLLRHDLRPSLAALAGSTTLLATPALAEDDVDAAGAQAIVVTGSGLAQSPATPAYDTVEIGREAITSSVSGRIEDVLASVAGFQQFRRSDSRSSNPSAQGVTLRALGGNASSRTLVLLDGVPVTNPFFGYVPFNALSPATIGAVRVTRGGGAGAFGSGAVSGTIEMSSANPDEIGPVRGVALVNDRGETQASATVAPKLGSGFLVASAQWDRGKGFWTIPRDQRVEASARAAYESWSGSVRGVAPLTDTVEVQASALAYNDERTLRFDGADSSASGQQGSLRLIGRGEWQFEALAYAQAQDFSSVTISSTRYVKALDQIKTPTFATGGKLEVRPPVADNTVLRLGADLRNVEGHLAEAPYSTATGLATAFRRAGGEQSDLGLYIENDLTLGDLVVTGGARLDRWTIRNGFYRELDASGVLAEDTRYANRDGWAPNFRGGLLWHAGPAIALRATAYTGLRLPTLNELYRPFVVFPITTNANATLKPERLRGYEAGIDLTPAEGVTLSLTAFDNKLKNAIANVTLDDTTRERQNVDAIHAQGIEASTAVAIGQIRFDGSLAWTDSKVEADDTQAALDGMQPSQVPKLAAAATLAWLPAAGWRLAASLRHVGRQYEDDLESQALPAATTLGAYARIPVHPLVAVILRGENLTDERIVTRDQSGSIDLGTPRTIWAGIEVGI